MLIGIIDKNGEVGHPTDRIGYIRKKIHDGTAKVIKGSFINNDFEVVQILDLEIDKSKTIKAKFRLGIDPGYQHIGFCLIKETVDKCKVLLSGEFILRTADVTNKMQERAMYRNSRRHNRRHKDLRSKASSGRPVKFRAPRWKNRKKKPFAPTHRYLMDMHTNLVERLTRYLPAVEIHLEYAAFDSQKMLNPGIYPNQYSIGPQLGYANVKAYVLARDHHTCQICSKNKGMLEVHHIIFRSQGGTNAPSNLVTLCKSCHAGVHSGKLTNPHASQSQMRDSGVLNSIMPELMRRLECSHKVIKTYGYITKEIRQTYSIEKTHANDAMCISMSDMQGLDVSNVNVDINNQVIQYFQSFRRHNTRAASIRIEDRKYGVAIGTYANGNTKYEVLAWNKRDRTGQASTKTSLEQFKRDYPYQRLELIKPGRVVMSRSLSGYEIKFSPGDLVYSTQEEKVFTVQGWASTQGKVIEVGGATHPTRYCDRGIRNRGMSDYLRC